MKRALYQFPPQVFLSHTSERSFIGPGAISLPDGSVLMAAPWGRPPANFEQLAARFPVPLFYRSDDGGRNWREAGRMQMDWPVSGMISDGGISFLRLQDGRLAFLAHRHVEGLHGGGLPVFSVSLDDGETWSPARLLDGDEGIWYVMNDRLIQLRSGRLVVPVARMEPKSGCVEGDESAGLCFLSDDAGNSWTTSAQPATLADGRGMAEPSIAETADGRLLMLARTGSGCLYASWSQDEGYTWSVSEPTTLPAACSPLTLKALPDGRLIVFYNHTPPLAKGAFFPRTPLVYAVSEDSGKTWSEPFLVDESGAILKDRQVIYPAICFTDEGMLVIYSRHAADPAGTFGGQYSHKYPDCGGVCCLLEYPAPRVGPREEWGEVAVTLAASR